MAEFLSYEPSRGTLVPSDLIESYVMSEARYNLGIYAQRLLYRLLETAQKYIYDVDFTDGSQSRKVEIGEWGDADVVLPVRSILFGDDDRNYDKAKKAVEELMGKFIEYDDGVTYKATQILNEVEMNRLKGRMVIRVNRNLWRAMLDFSKGYRMIDLETVLKLRSGYSMRLYSLVCMSKQPLTFTIDQLRKMWGLEGRYAMTKDFVRNTVALAKEELDRVSPFSFEYTLNCSKSDPVNQGRRGRLKVTSITFYPVRRIHNMDFSGGRSDIRRQVSAGMVLSREVMDLLKNKFGFDYKGVSANLPVFDAAQKNMDLLSFLDKIAPVALRAKNPPGYVVGALRKQLVKMGMDEDSFA